MKITLYPPIALHEVGGRSNNEDFIFPPKEQATIHDRWFMVCDGVGGAAKGEIASQLVCRKLDEFFTTQKVELVDSEYILSAFRFAQDQIDEYIGLHPEAEGMATTLTLLYFHPGGATIAHCGDSRVYHLRQGQILWKTEDHSMVNMMIRKNLISVEEAADYKQNIIMKAMQGHKAKPTEPDVQIVQDIKNEDYFFLCSDGIREQLTDQMLEDILALAIPDREKMQQINSICQGQTRDNFSAYLVHVQEAEGNPVLMPEAIVEGVLIETESKGLKNESLKKGYPAEKPVMDSGRQNNFIDKEDIGNQKHNQRIIAYTDNTHTKKPDRQDSNQNTSYQQNKKSGSGSLLPVIAILLVVMIGILLSVIIGGDRQSSSQHKPTHKEEVQPRSVNNTPGVTAPSASSATPVNQSATSVSPANAPNNPAAKTQAAATATSTTAGKEENKTGNNATQAVSGNVNELKDKKAGQDKKDTAKTGKSANQPGTAKHN